MDYNSSSSDASVTPNTMDYSSNENEKKKKSGKKIKGGGGGGSMKLSTDPQSVAARERRHRISDRFKTLQSLVPGGTKMDTVSMLEEAIHYVKFLKTQIWLHQNMMSNGGGGICNSSSLDDINDHELTLFYHHFAQQYSSVCPSAASGVVVYDPPTFPPYVHGFQGDAHPNIHNY